MLKGIVNGVEKDIIRIRMLVNGTYKEGWEVRDNQDRLIWGYNSTISGVPPLTFKGGGTPLTAWSISGDMVQNGTPTPDAPIQPEECGKRTGNLASLILGKVPRVSDGTLVTFDGLTSEYVPITSMSDTFSLTFDKPGSTKRFHAFFYSGDTLLNTKDLNYGTAITTYGVSSTVDRMRIRIDYGGATVSNVMLAKGSAALPYEPYGYKIPITCAGQTVPVYLGQVSTVRRVKKLVLTGAEETFGYANLCLTFSFDGQSASIQPMKGIIICDRYEGVTPKYRDQLKNNQCCITRNYNQIAIRDNNFTTVDAWKSYLATQYAAGTPVCVWYVLAEPETGIINEPLCKIGEYADELHSEDAGVSIPTVKGSNTLTVDTTLSPSSVSITGHIKPYYTVMTYIDYTDMTKSYTIGDVNKVNAFTKRRRCNMLDDGTITAFYGDPTFVEDGSNGQVMVYQPKFYYKVEPVLLDGIKIRKCKYYISDYQLPGYKLHPAFIDRTDPNNLKEFPFVCIGAYEGCLQNGDTYITDDSASSTSYKLSSIAFTDTATNGVKPSSGVISPFGTIGNYETTASNRGTGWHIENIWITSMNQLMFVIEMCNPNSQTALGSGVTNIPDTTNTANNSSLVGSTSSLGNGSGRATTTYSNYNGTTTAQTDDNKTAVSYRGMENPFGNIWKWIDGMTIKNTSATEHVPYICKSFAYTRDSTLTNYDMVNVNIPGTGYVTAFGYDPNFDWLFISAETNSSDTGTIRDYLSIKNTGYNCAMLGGSWNGDAIVGLFYWALINGSGSRNRGISARICYLPQT